MNAGTLWSYWESSEGTPPIVDLCVRSWKKYSGFEKIVMIYPDTVGQYLDRSDLPKHFVDLPPVKKANAVRLALISKFGGVWFDAGVLLSSPLLPFLANNAGKQGLFVYQGVGSDRAVATWMIAGDRGQPLVSEWSARYNRFFSRKRIHNAHSPGKSPSTLATHILARMNCRWMRSSPARTAYWSKPPLSWLPFYPYFIMHYILNRQLANRDMLRQLSSVGYLRPTGALRLRQLLDRSVVGEIEYRKVFSNSGIHKLNTWRSYSRGELEALAFHAAL